MADPVTYLLQVFEVGVKILSANFLRNLEDWYIIIFLSTFLSI